MQELWTTDCELLAFQQSGDYGMMSTYFKVMNKAYIFYGSKGIGCLYISSMYIYLMLIFYILVILLKLNHFEKKKNNNKGQNGQSHVKYPLFPSKDTNIQWNLNSYPLRKGQPQQRTPFLWQ